MKLPSTFEKLKSKHYELTGRQRLMVLGLIGSVVTLLTVVYTDTSEVTVETKSPSANSQTIAKTPSKPGQQVAPVNQAVASTRDPFALPPENKPEKNEPSNVSPPIPNKVPNSILNSIPNMAPPTPVPQANLKLTGVIGSAEESLAVIMSGDKSNSYGLNEMIGEYKLVAINSDYVILTNANGKLVLHLATARQMGGNN